MEKDYLKGVIGIESVKNQIVFHIKNYEANKHIVLTFGKLTGDVFMDFFREINEITQLSESFRKNLNFLC